MKILWVVGMSTICLELKSIKRLSSIQILPNVKMAFYESSLVDYRIEDHKLVPYSDNTPNKYIVVEEKTVVGDLSK